jgi:ABC-type lipoprotein release transport system permease subunit
MANLLQVTVGDKIVLMTQSADSSLGSDAYRVKGIFETSSPEFDKRFVFANLECVATLASLQGFHEMVLRLPEESRSLRLQSELQKQVGDKLKVTTWREALPSMATMIRYNHATLTLLTLILFTVISLGIVNTLLMSVFERTREFGVMLALGTAPEHVAVIIALESLFLGIVSSIIATVIGLSVLAYHAKVGFDLTPLLGESHAINDFNLDMVIYPVIRFRSYAFNVMITQIVVMLAALYPASRAARLNPVESLRHT